MNTSALADRIDTLLPQTQCTRCGYDGCRPYAEAIAAARAPINQCPPGGAAGIAKLAGLLGQPPLPLNPANGTEQPLAVAVIDEARCIGCTLCIQACPVDAIVGAPKRMHTVLAAHCTGCDLCVAPCPVDCIAMVCWQPPRAWSAADADAARARYDARKARMAREQQARDARLASKAPRETEACRTGDQASAGIERRQSIVRAAVERARARRQAATDAGR